MALLNCDDLNTSTSSLSTDIADNNNIVTCIDSFIDGARTKLSGADYEKAIQKLNGYKTAFQERQELAKKLMSAIQSSNSALKNYMDGYTILDSSKIGDLESALAVAKQNLATAEAQNGSTITDSKTGETRVLDLSADIGRYKANIIEIEKELNLLKGLEAADANACSYFENLDGDMRTYTQIVDGIEVQSIAISADSINI